MPVPQPDNGLVIFIRKLPAQVIEPVLRSRLQPHLLRVGIGPEGFDLHKPKARGIATMHVFNRIKGEEFLASMKNNPSTLNLSRFPVEFERHENQDGGALIKDQKFINQQVVDAYIKSAPLESKIKAMTLDEQGQQQGQHAPVQKTFNLTATNCGNWRYGKSGSPVFVSEYNNNRPGKLLIGSRSIVAILNRHSPSNEWTHRIDFEWDCIDTIYTQRGRYPSLMITCHHAPTMYRRIEMEQPMSLLRIFTPRNQRKKARVPCLDIAHSRIAGSCLTYELVFEANQSLRVIQNLVEHIPDGPTSMRISVQTIVPKVPFDAELQELNLWLSNSQLPFAVRFQAMKLVLNGHLAPGAVTSLIQILEEALAEGCSILHCAEALRQFNRDLPWPGPQTPYKDMAPRAMEDLLRQLLSGDLENASTYRALKKKNNTLAMIHHARITPTGLYLEGPEPEVTNRVLRKYSDHLDSFLRVTFSDEDGGQLQFRFDTSNDDVYNKFQAILDDSLPLCGNVFQFFGFSQSSLRSQTAWFMAPFPVTKLGVVLTPAQAIEQIGDFSHLRSPAKCAARIGQAFTDTNGFVTIQAEAEHDIPDVERNARVFSDGCGTMSADLAFQVALRYERFTMREPPTVFQIRFRGVKGVLSVDPTLDHGQIRIRPSMRKFETAATRTHDLEICGMADKVRSMYLNRGLIKVLEDLGVPQENFLELAHETLQRLQGSTNTFTKAAKLLEDEHIGSSAGLPGLLRRMDHINIGFRKDRMLCAIVEMAAFCRLRAMKYKGRIPVKKGVKLMGIMDETGYLQEGQIHVAWVDKHGRRLIHAGKVAVTRSPTNHPGDVQLAIAVDVPAKSPLRKLYNCVIFSQHGDRDLPSQLGGGDLDGDLYDVFWDERIMPTRLFLPAEYPRLPAIDLGRAITVPDMSKHFIDFMKNDNVGILANQLLVISDRMELGTRDPNCIIISELMSTALDYPKTGIVANMRNLPRFDKSWKPDFMAPGPKAKIEKIDDPLKVVMHDELEATPDDPVVALDPDERKTRYYESPHILGRLYRLVDEKNFYNELQEQTRDHHRGQSAMKDVLAYACRAIKGFEFEQYLDTAREIRITYEDNVKDISHAYALHSAQPLQEIEVITGAVLGSIFVRKLRDLTSEMKRRFDRDVAYTRERIRVDDQGSDEESVPRSVACLYVSVKEKGRKVGKHSDARMWSFAYVAAAVCLEEIARFHGGRLLDF